MTSTLLPKLRLTPSQPAVSEAIAQLAETIKLGARPTVVAGDPNGISPDSPKNRVDPNT